MKIKAKRALEQLRKHENCLNWGKPLNTWLSKAEEAFTNKWEEYFWVCVKNGMNHYRAGKLCEI